MNHDLEIMEIDSRNGCPCGVREKGCWAGSLRSGRGMLGCLLRWVHIIQVLGFRNLCKHKQETRKSLEVDE